MKLRQSFVILTLTYSPRWSPNTSMSIWNGHPQGEIIFDIDAATRKRMALSLGDRARRHLHHRRRDRQRHQSRGGLHPCAHGQLSSGRDTREFPAAGRLDHVTPPAPPPAWTSDHTNPNAAARFLVQGTFESMAGTPMRPVFRTPSSKSRLLAMKGGSTSKWR